METIESLLKTNEFVALKEYIKDCKCGYGFMVKELCLDGNRYFCIGCDDEYFEPHKINTDIKQFVELNKKLQQDLKQITQEVKKEEKKKAEMVQVFATGDEGNIIYKNNRDGVRTIQFYIQTAGQDTLIRNLQTFAYYSYK